MAKQVRIQGVIYSVPDNATMDQIQEYVASKGVTAKTNQPLDNASILAQQKAKYPTSAEQGGRPGRAQVSFLDALVDTEPGTETMMGPEAAFLGAGAPGNVFSKVPSAIETVAAPTATVANTFRTQLKAAPAVQAVESAANAVRTLPGVRTIIKQTEKAGEATSERLLHSLLRPDKKMFDFGADPIAEAKKLGPKISETSMAKSNQEAMRFSEAKIDAAAADRAAAARHIGADDGIDIEAFVRGPIQQEMGIARDNNNATLAQNLQGFMDAQLDRIRRTYGSTYLKPTEIIAEKRILSKATKFTADPIGQSMNVARMEMYKGIDGALNRLLPQTKEINHAYAGQIELDKLLEKRILQGKNQPLLAETAFGSAKKLFPETLPKTLISRAVSKPKQVTIGGQTYEFYPRPQPGPYATGYQPSSESIGPKGPRAEEVNGGVFRPGVPAESAGFPRTRTEYKPRRPKLTP